jgi:two-component system response regulator YesN
MYKILIVDDEIWMCEGIKKMVHENFCDFKVEDMAEDGQQALEWINNKHYDLVITDIRMPAMDGLEMIKRIREQGHLMPIIVISGHSEFTYAKTVIRYDVADYILKPLDKEEIISILEKCKKQLDRELKSGLETSDETSNHHCKNSIELVEYLKEKVNNHYMEELSLSLAAQDAGYNASYVSRIFKLETGIGFAQYLTEIRMKAAKEKLLETELTVVEISRRVGYWDEKYFSKLFKREIGITPTEFRNKQ